MIQGILEVLSYFMVFLIGVSSGAWLVERAHRHLDTLLAESARLGVEVADMKERVDSVARKVGMPCYHTHLTKRYGGKCVDCGQVMT